MADDTRVITRENINWCIAHLCDAIKQGDDEERQFALTKVMEAELLLKREIADTLEVMRHELVLLGSRGL